MKTKIASTRLIKLFSPAMRVSLYAVILAVGTLLLGVSVVGAPQLMPQVRHDRLEPEITGLEESVVESKTRLCHFEYALPQPSASEFQTLVNILLMADTRVEETETRACDDMAQIVAGTFPGQSDWHLLKTLCREHPRLIVLDADIAAVKKTVATDSFAHKLFGVLKDRAEGELS